MVPNCIVKYPEEGGNDKFKRLEPCAWIDGETTTVFRAIKVSNSFVENKGDFSGRFLIRIETDTGVFRAALVSLVCLTVMRVSVELIIVGSNDKFKQSEPCA